MYVNQRGADGMGLGMDRRQAYLTGLLARGALGMDRRQAYLTGLLQRGSLGLGDDYGDWLASLSSSSPAPAPAPVDWSTVDLSGNSLPPILPTPTPVAAIPPNIASPAPAQLAISPITVPAPPNTIITPSGAAAPAPGFVVNASGKVVAASSPSGWLASSMIPGVSNSTLLMIGGGALALSMLSKGKRRR